MEQQQPDRVGRRLAAIVAADVAGYSRLMGLDEVGTARTLREHRKVTDALVAKHGGRLVKTTGDGVLLEFPSVVDAVECAVAVQAVMAQRNEGAPQDRRMLLRMGINLGDILIEGDDILGDGVNVAARLEGIAEPGGICVSSSAYEQVRGKVSVDFTDLGEQTLKNIARPIRAFAVRTKGEATILPSRGAALPWPDKPSIAVLPFQNMSGDPEQEYFADGMVEDIITELSRFKGLFVIARNSSFTYKGNAVDIKQVGSELGVRYLLEGSVRKSGQRVRITGQLIEAGTGAHLWAEKFEGQLQDAFELQDKITVSVVGAIAPRLIEAEVERAKRKPPESWDAYDYYLRGLAFYAQRTAEANEQALPLFRKAIHLNPEFGLAYMRAAACLFQRPQYGGLPLTDNERSEVLQLNDRALALDPGDAFVVAWASLFITFLGGDIERGSDYADRAITINPNLSNAWNARGWISSCIGEAERSLECFDRAIRLNPLDEWTVFVAMRGRLGPLVALDRHLEAIEQAKKLIARSPNDLFAWFWRWVLEADPTIRVRYPQLRGSDLKRMFSEPVRSLPNRASLEKAIDALGLPE
jgi:TolB-like protein/tetratricopeptide (TPR) repeat protein